MLNKIGYIKGIAFDALWGRCSRGYENHARDAEYIKPGLNSLSFIEKVDEWYELDDELDVVTEWKQAHVVREFIEWQAKRFARWYTDKEVQND